VTVPGSVFIVNGRERMNQVLSRDSGVDYVEHNMMHAVFFREKKTRFVSSGMNSMVTDSRCN
jgi:hypothetical protein